MNSHIQASIRFDALKDLVRSCSELRVSSKMCLYSSLALKNFLVF